MAQKEMITNDKIGSATVVQHEDAVLKTAAQFFAKELLPYLGIDGKVISSAPTESIVLNLKKFYEDINLIMEDGTWKHFEFQSKNEEFPIVKDTTPNMMNPRLYTTSYNKPQGQQFDDTAVLSFIKLQYT